MAAVRRGGCRCLFGDAGNADGPHELIDILVPVAIIAGTGIVVATLRRFYYDKKKIYTRS